jgi:hypothetical protein
MKKLIALTVLSLLFMLPAKAANTPPPGAFSNMFWNNGLGQYAPVIVGQGLCLSTTSSGCVAPTPPIPPSGTLLTDNSSTNVLTDDNGNQLTNN